MVHVLWDTLSGRCSFWGAEKLCLELFSCFSTHLFVLTFSINHLFKPTFSQVLFIGELMLFCDALHRINLCKGLVEGSEAGRGQCSPGRLHMFCGL